MTNNPNNDQQEVKLPLVMDARLTKDKEKNWILTIHTSDEKKYSIHPKKNDLNAFFAQSRGKSQEETKTLRKELGEKYLPQAMLNSDSKSVELNDSPNRSHEERALDVFAQQMIEKIESIQSDWKKPWFTEGALGWPRNMNNRPYNGMNAMFLMLNAEKNNYKLPVWATFDRVVGLNYEKGKEGQKVKATDKEGEPLPKVCINKGEKSMPVFITTFSVVNRETNDKISFDDYKQLSEEEKNAYKVYPKLQVYNVFNIDQTNIETARPELYKKLADGNGVQRPEQTGEEFTFPAVDEMINENKWICPIKPTYGDDAYFSISKREIVIPEKKQFVNGESFYSNLFHEMAHSTGSEGVLDRLKPTQFGSREYATEELVAELSAALVSQRFGLEKNIKEDSCAYLKSWLDSLKENPGYIKTVMLDVKKASALITEGINKVQLELDNTKGVSKEETHTESSQLSETVDTQVAKSSPSLANQTKNLEVIGEFEIPEWSLSYLQNGDCDDLEDDEIELVDNFVQEKLGGKQFIMVVDWDKSKDFNNAPTFGTRNPYASPEFGESPFQATKTYNVTFLEPVKQTVGQREEEHVAKMIPKAEDKEQVRTEETSTVQHIHRGR